MQLHTYTNPTIYSMMPIVPGKNPMKLVIIARKTDYRKFNLKKQYEFGEPIPIPPNRVILVTIPDGVFRCNLNKGIFAEDRKFIQNEGCDYPHILKFRNLEYEQNPFLTIKAHYSGSETDVIVEFI